MYPLVQALLSPWNLRVEVLAVLIPLGILYTLGWRRLRVQSVHGRLATWPKLAAYLIGLFVVAAALMSPVDSLGDQLFLMHMLQHMLFMMLAAPLLLLANPFPFFIWSLPAGSRHQVAGLFSRDSRFRRGLALTTGPGVAWIAFTIIYYGWHDSTLYNLALYHSGVHDLQHITFFLASLLFWFHVIRPAPRIHGRFPGWGRMAYLIGAVPINMMVGVTIAFTSEVLYSYYTTVPRIWGLTVMQDQKLAGALMWIPGSMMFILAALIVLASMFPNKPVGPDPATGWDSDEAMVAPGLEHRVAPRRHPPVRPISAPKAP